MKSIKARPIIFLFFIVLLLVSSSWADTKNGFDLSNSSIHSSQILAGGPPRDGIPSIDHPKFIPISQVDYLKEDDIVIGLTRGKTARAYPTRILVWHEIVNDIIGNDAVAVTYCPLCGTAMVFDRTINGQVTTFGVSGLLYQSDVLLYDRQTESLWSQLAMKAVTGPAKGEKLKWLPSEYLTYKAWKEKYPSGKVLSTETGYLRNYGGNAYASYFASDRPMFPVPKNRPELPDKAWVIGIVVDGIAKAYPVKTFPSNPIIDQVGKIKLKISFKKETRHLVVLDGNNTPIPSVMVFWFAWQAFYPNTELWAP